MNYSLQNYVIFLFFICILIVTSSSAWIPVDAASPNISNNYLEKNIQSPQKELFAKIQDKGQLQVIVELNTDYQLLGSENSAKIEKHKAKIAITQNSLLHVIPGLQDKTLYNFKYVPMMLMNVDENAMNALLSSPLIKSIHEDMIGEPTLDLSGPVIGLDDSFNAGYDGKGWTVAILDTGVENTHSFFTGRIVSEACYSTNDGVMLVSSVCPLGVTNATGPGTGTSCHASIRGCDHGTHVAGIAAGNSNGTGLDGVAKEANIIAIQVFSRWDNPSDCGGIPPCARYFSSDVMKGLERVFELKDTYQIASVNLSLGTGEKFTTPCVNAFLQSSIDLLRSAGIATMVASGNDFYSDGISHPACIPTAISVGSTTIAFSNSDATSPPSTDAVSSFSNSASFLNLLAPGEWILSPVPGDGIGLKRGTSMATPQVVGAWAVVKQKFPSKSVDDVVPIFTATGVNVTDIKNGISKPRIQLNGALSDVIISAGNGTFIPNSTVINQGQKVLWYNDDNSTRLFWSGNPVNGPDEVFETGDIKSRDSYFRTFNEPGVFDYFDPVHPTATGEVVVLPIPCSIPTSGDWNVTSTCTLSISETAPRNVLVQNNSTLVILDGVNLDIDFEIFNLTIKSGSVVLIKSGGAIT
ncbi:MAG: S8 family serine peptidase [Nitrosopumilus sp.]|nr:S8 family serine peptidase [Nitrosopumilus sp.]